MSLISSIFVDIVSVCFLTQLLRWGTIIGLFLLAVLRVHALRNGLQRSGIRGIFKMHGRKDSSRFSKTKLSFERKKIDQKLTNGNAEQIF